jgi:hypothetical protein
MRILQFVKLALGIGGATLMMIAVIGTVVHGKQVSANLEDDRIGLYVTD